MATGPLTTLHVIRDSGLLVLVAEAEIVDPRATFHTEQLYEVVAVASTLEEARWFAAEDMAARLRQVEAGEDPLHPEAYAVWGRNPEGEFVRLEEILP